MPEKRAYLRVSRGFYVCAGSAPMPEGTVLLGIVTPPVPFDHEVWLEISHPDLPADWAPGEMMLVNAILESGTDKVRFVRWEKVSDA